MSRLLRALCCVIALLPASASAQWIGGGGSGGTGSGAGGTFTYSDSGTSLTGTQFAPIGGGGLPTATEAEVASKAATSTTIANLQVSLSAVPGGGNSLAVTLRKAGVSQTLTCTIGAAATTCQDLTHLVTVNQNDLIDWQLVTTGTISGTPTVTIQASNGASAVGVSSVTGSGHLTCTPTTGGVVCSDSGLLVAANNLSDVTAATARTNLGLSGNSCAAGQYASGIDQQLGLTCSLIPLTSSVTGVLPIVNGGSGSNSPAIVAGTNITVSGSWPNQTINSTASSGGFSALTSGTNTGAAMIVGTGASLTTSGSGSVTATAVPATGITGILPIASGGTATASPSLVAGTNVTISGSWPNQTINSSGGGGGGGSPGGSTNDVQYNAGSSTFGGVALTNGQLVVGQTAGIPLAKTVSGDATLSAGGALVVTKTNGTSFGALATTTPGTGVSIAAAIPLGSAGAFMTKGGSACADLSNGATGCSTATGTSGATLPLLNAANTWSATQTFSAANPLLVGANSGNVGSIKLFGDISGDATLTVPSIAGTATRFALPATNGSNTNVLQTDGSGNTSWVALGVGTGTVTSVTLGVPGSSIFGTTGTNPITTSGTFGISTTGTSGAIPYFNTTSTLNSSALLAANKVMVGGGAGTAPATDASAGLVLGALSLGTSGTAGSVSMGNATSGTVTLQPVTGALGAVTASLPANTGTIAELNLAQTWTAKQTMTGSGPLEVGANGGNVGSLKLYGNTSGDATLVVPAAAGTATRFQLPSTNGSNTNVLQTDGSGNTSWTSAGTVSNSGTLTGGKVLIGGGTTVVTADANAGLVAGALSLGASGTAGSVLMGNATSGTVTLQPTTGALGTVTATLPANTGTIAELNLAQTWTAKQTMTGSGPLELGVNAGNVGSIKLFGNTSGDVTVKAAAGAGTATNFTLPTTNGSSSQVLTTDGSGNTSWGGGSRLFVGTFAGTANAQTMASPDPAGFALTNGYMVCGMVATTNTGDTTWAINGLTAKHVNVGTDAGLAVLGGGELIANNQACGQYQSSADVFVLLNTPSGGITNNATSATVSQVQWSAGRTFTFKTASQTLTLPASGTTLLSSNGAVIVQATVAVTLQASGSDTINGGSGGGSLTIPANSLAVVTGDGASPTLFSVAMLSTPTTLSQGVGFLVGSNPNLAPIFTIPTAGTISSIEGRVMAAVGTTATVDVYKAASTVACSAGTKLNTTAFNANGAAGTNQVLGNASTALAAHDTICLVTANGSNFTASTTGIWGITVNYTVP